MTATAKIATFVKIAAGAYRASNLVPVEIHKTGSGKTPWIVCAIDYKPARLSERAHELGRFGTLGEAKSFALPLINHPQGVAAAQGWCKLKPMSIGIAGHARAARIKERQTAYVTAWRTRRIVATGALVTSFGPGTSEHRAEYVLMPATAAGDGAPYFVQDVPVDVDLADAARELGIDLAPVVTADDAKPGPTTPDNAGARIAAGSLIAELAGADYVTTSEAADVLAWCREWAMDCQWADTSPCEVSETAARELLRACNRHIDGGLAFVLADVRRCADEARAARHARNEEDVPEMPSPDLYAPYSVKRLHSGTEDGYLYYVVTEDGERVDGAGHIHELSAAWDAVGMAEDAKREHEWRRAERRAELARREVSYIGAGVAPWGELPQSTRDRYAARWAREAYAADVPELVSDAQALTLVALAEHIGEAWQCSPAVHVAQYGTNGAVLAVLSCDSPGANPIVRLWAGGDSYSVTAEADWDYYAPKLRTEYEHVVTERADDAAFVIEPGGTYSRHGA